MATADLGFTLAHEHVISGTLSVRMNWPHLFDREAEIAIAHENLDTAYEAGVRTLVDLTTFDLGRDAAIIREVAAGTRMQIILATGLHLRMPNYFNRREPDRIVALFVQDIEKGIAGTGVKAGAIKVATEEELTPQIELMLRAAALTQRATGAPIMTHSNPFAGTGAAQQDVFASEGVDLASVVIGHSGDTDDLEYLSKVMDRGSTIGMDRYGTHIGADTEKRTDVIAELCRRGYADRMVLSHDASSYSLNMPRHIRAERFPEWNYLTIPTKVIPGLRERGTPEEQIAALTVGNPRRIFEQQGAYSPARQATSPPRTVSAGSSRSSPSGTWPAMSRHCTGPRRGRRPPRRPPSPGPASRSPFRGPAPRRAGSCLRVACPRGASPARAASRRARACGT